MHRRLAGFFESLAGDLSLWVRHAAWLNAVPERADNDKSKKPNVSRREALEKDGDEAPEMPPIDAAYLIGYLWEIGPSVAAGMGSGPISHTEIESWQRNTGIELNAWEARTLRRLSMDYVSESQKATAIDAEAPWQESPDVIEAPNRAAEDMRSAIRALAAL